VVWPQSHWDDFLRFGLKTGSYGFMIWVSNSLRRFLGLGLKTKHASVYWLRHKTDGERMVRDTRQDLVACFTWKQVALGFPSLAIRLTDARLWVVYVALS
jgi:hypothetical protein